MEGTRLDLQYIETYKLNQISFADSSQYIGAPVNPSFEITVPGQSKLNVPFSPSLVNIYNAQNLKVSNDNPNVYLPDGIYIVRYSIEPNLTMFTEKSFMRISHIDSLYKRLFLQIDNNCDCNTDKQRKLKDQLRDIKLLIDGSVAAVDNCDTEGGTFMYRKAYKFIQNMKLCECK